MSLLFFVLFLVFFIIIVLYNNKYYQKYLIYTFLKKYIWNLHHNMLPT